MYYFKRARSTAWVTYHFPHVTSVDSDNKMTGGSQPTAGLKLHYMDSSKTDQKGHWKKDIFLDNFPNIKCDEEKM